MPCRRRRRITELQKGPRSARRFKKLPRIDNGQCWLGVWGLPLTMLKPQERTMAPFIGFRKSLKSGIDASALPSPSHIAPAARPRSSRWIIWTALAVTLAAGPALPQAGVQLVKVDLSVVAKGYRMSKLIGSNVINDKNEKSGTVDEVIADKDKKQLSFAVLQVGGFLGF